MLWELMIALEFNFVDRRAAVGIVTFRDKSSVFEFGIVPRLVSPRIMPK